MFVCFRHYLLICLLCAPESQDSKDGLSMSAGVGTEDRKQPPVPEECGKSKVASWLTSQSSSTGASSVKIEGGMKTEKKVREYQPLLCFPVLLTHSSVLCPFLLYILSFLPLLQEVMTLSDSDDVQTISSGSDDNKEREKKTQGKGKTRSDPK